MAAQRRLQRGVLQTQTCTAAALNSCILLPLRRSLQRADPDPSASRAHFGGAQRPPAFALFTLPERPLEPRNYAGMSAAGLQQEHSRGLSWPLPEPLDDSGVCGEPPGDTEADLEKAIVADEAAAGPTLAALEQGKLLLSGGIAGAFSKSCTAPLARLTILYQVCRRRLRLPAACRQLQSRPPLLCLACSLIQPHPLPSCAPLQVQGMQPAAAAGAALPSQRAGVAAALRHVVQREGLAALWKGNGVTIIHRLPYSSANFWVYEQVRCVVLLLLSWLSVLQLCRPCAAQGLNQPACCPCGLAAATQRRMPAGGGGMPSSWLPSSYQQQRPLHVPILLLPPNPPRFWL